jgi:FtsP/CotA-like multicopper oxidase with cupredoxin domain
MEAKDVARTGVDRRLVLRAAVGAGGVLALGGIGATWSKVSAAAPPVKATINPLRLPATVGPTTALRAASGVTTLGDERPCKALLYNNGLPGPNYVVRAGEQVSVAFTNDLDADTTVHWHGLIIPTAVDGQPHEAIAPGSSLTYAFTVRQRAGMSWYHPHPHLATASQVAYGLAGGFIIRDSVEDALGLPSGPYEVPLVIRDTSLDKAGNLSYNGKASGFSGNLPLVNGTRDAELEVDRAWYRFRILVGSNSRLFKLSLSSRAAFRLIGNDGGLLPRAVDLQDMELSPGERVDVLVDCTGIGAGQTVALLDGNSGWTLLRLTGTGSTPATAPSVPPSGAILSTDGPAFGSATNVPKRLFSFDGMTRINGLVYDMNRISFDVPSDTVEEWVFRTNGNAPHPVHVHGASFQVVSRTGGRGRLFPWEDGWKDTVLLHDRETVTVRLNFDSGYKGRYLLHCHKLEHEDAGMMLNFAVV